MSTADVIRELIKLNALPNKTNRLPTDYATDPTNTHSAGTRSSITYDFSASATPADGEMIVANGIGAAGEDISFLYSNDPEAVEPGFIIIGTDPDKTAALTNVLSYVNGHAEDFRVSVGVSDVPSLVFSTTVLGDAAPVITGSTTVPDAVVTDVAGAGLSVVQYGTQAGSYLTASTDGGEISTDATQLELTPETSANFVYADALGVVATNRTGFPDGSLPIAIVNVEQGNITSVSDVRHKPRSLLLTRKFDVRDYGYKGNMDLNDLASAEDDTFAINECLNHLRNKTQQSGFDTYAYGRIVFPPNSRARITSTLDFSGLSYFMVEGNGTLLAPDMNGGAALDFLGNQQFLIQDLTVNSDMYGQSDDEYPEIGLQFGQYNNYANNARMMNVNMQGHYGLTSAINAATEDTLIKACNFENRNYRRGAYAFILDGRYHFPISGNDGPPPHLRNDGYSFNETHFDSTMFFGAGRSVWICGNSGLKFTNCFARNGDGNDGFAGDAAIYIHGFVRSLDLDLHVEGYGTSDIMFGADANSAALSISGFRYNNHLEMAKYHTFELDAKGGVKTTASLVGGSGYTPGTYTKVPLVCSLEGTNVEATIVVNGGGAVSTVTITVPGDDVSVNEVLTFGTAATDIVGAGSSFQITASAVHALTSVTLSDADIKLHALHETDPTFVVFDDNSKYTVQGKIYTPNSTVQNLALSKITGEVSTPSAVTLTNVGAAAKVKSGVPIASDVPTDRFMIIKDSSGGGVYACFNDNGTLKKAQLT